MKRLLLLVTILLPLFLVQSQAEQSVESTHQTVQVVAEALEACGDAIEKSDIEVKVGGIAELFQVDNGFTGLQSPRCCKVCTKGKACGDSCIARNKTCHKGRGCACNG
ncbi:hypothetical protein [Aliidiomarina haloalkalitolerans]|uniref:Uncharacterized protein n=1 Tax=Aliidiomarina haloalkalitolerans TaxID=859059 RepID=A0A432VR40_9GAMM|nr:hypothetical protein [Aliidiomarina haloalkalitolerans]RUO18717.1 hypothetical protein CWE06_10775 [Aliidiomarina haloalkalitolerans]